MATPTSTKCTNIASWMIQSLLPLDAECAVAMLQAVTARPDKNGYPAAVGSAGASAPPVLPARGSAGAGNQ